jgi:hypothetical protein
MFTLLNFETFNSKNMKNNNVFALGPTTQATLALIST